MMLAGLLALMLFTQDQPAAAQDLPALPPHYGYMAATCPVGGEAFQAPVAGHYSTFGLLPDGQPVGSVEFPLLLTECPGNGLMWYDDFSPETVKKLEPLLANADYRALRGTETSYYRAAWLARRVGDPERAARLLLSATWQAKNADPAGAQARRYNEAFIAAARALPVDPANLGSTVLRIRAANALRELGRWDEAETLRASITIDPAAGGGERAEDRAHWQGFVTTLAAPIARRDASRSPIDLLNDRHAAGRCIAPEYPNEHSEPVPPLTAFEAEYCKRPKLAEMIAKFREYRRK